MKHRFQSAKSDGGDATLVRPSNWNAIHVHGVTSTSTNLTLDATHDTVLATAGAGGITITLPDVSSIGAGTTYLIKKVDSGAGSVIVDAAGTDTIDGLANYELPNQWQFVEIQGTGSQWVVTGVN
jgi:hypothetical protein